MPGVLGVRILNKGCARAEGVFFALASFFRLLGDDSAPQLRGGQPNELAAQDDREEVAAAPTQRGSSLTRRGGTPSPSLQHVVLQSMSEVCGAACADFDDGIAWVFAAGDPSVF
jgi:hypothetical protein